MKAEIIQAQREIIQGYYNRIVMQQPDIKTIIQWLEDDLQTIRMDNIVLNAENIINAPIYPHEVSKVKCDASNYYLAAACPSCKGFNTIKKEIRQDNGIIGSGFHSWVIDSWYNCKDCGTRFDKFK
jgi:transposase-like protein